MKPKQYQHRVGIFGGTFNPIHYGHLIIAENASEQYQLERVVFMPTGHTPHKPYAGEEMDRHRFHMIELAIAGQPFFSVSAREMKSASVNYTYHTLRDLNLEFPDTLFFFILGADSLRDFELWRHPELICEEAVILAAVREKLDEEKMDELISKLNLRFDGTIFRLSTPNFHVSGENIRDRVKKGRTIRYMTPDAVGQYIRKNRLYS